MASVAAAPTGRIALRRRQPVEADRQPRHLEGVTITHVSDLAAMRAAGSRAGLNRRRRVLLQVVAEHSEDHDHCQRDGLLLHSLNAGSSCRL